MALDELAVPLLIRRQLRERSPMFVVTLRSCLPSVVLPRGRETHPDCKTARFTECPRGARQDRDGRDDERLNPGRRHQASVQIAHFGLAPDLCI